MLTRVEGRNQSENLISNFTH